MASKMEETTTKEMMEKPDVDINSNPSMSSHSDLLEALSKMQELPDILQEGILFMGGGVAILLQAAIPGVIKEPQASEDLAVHLLENIQTTTSYIFCLTFGSKAQRKSLLDMLNRGGHLLNGSDPIFRLWVKYRYPLCNCYGYIPEDIWESRLPHRGASLPRIYSASQRTQHSSRAVAKGSSEVLDVLG
ncbi:hypothetical protein DTO282F9_2756 [Paecilomyces variotii]|nr:hypothetical protein DTO282F9_2756 [Paecilomyces variotii]